MTVTGSEQRIYGILVNNNIMDKIYAIADCYSWEGDYYISHYSRDNNEIIKEWTGRTTIDSVNDIGIITGFILNETTRSQFLKNFSKCTFKYDISSNKPFTTNGYEYHDISIYYIPGLHAGPNDVISKPLPYPVKPSISVNYYTHIKSLLLENPNIIPAAILFRMEFTLTGVDADPTVAPWVKMSNVSITFS